MVKHADLAGDLGAANDGDEGTLGVGEDRGEGVDLLLEQEAGDGRDVLGRANHGALGAVRGAEGVEDEDVAKGGKALADLGLVLLLAPVEADVLEHEDVTRLEGIDGSLGLVTVGVGDELHGQAAHLGELLGNRLEGELGLGAVALGATEMAHEDDAGVVLHEVLDRGEGRLDAGGVTHDTVLDGHVEVDAAQDALAVDVDVANGLLGKGHVWVLSSRARRACDKSYGRKCDSRDVPALTRKGRGRGLATATAPQLALLEAQAAKLRRRTSRST